jgi:hypothetical protein
MNTKWVPFFLWLFPLFLTSVPCKATEEINIVDIADVVINGSEEQDNIGIYMASCGDLNRDGLEEFSIVTRQLVGTPDFDNYDYIIFGATDFPPLIDLSKPPERSMIFYRAGGGTIKARGIGDFNQDGYEDMLVSDSRADYDNLANAGRGVIVFGDADLPTGMQDLENLPLDKILIRNYRASGGLGASRASAGDANHDGFPDIVLGTAGGQGEAFLIFGGTDLPSELQVNELGDKGVKLKGQIGFGRAADGVGDINGDGIDDFAVGSGSLADQRWGHIYIIYGATEWPSEIDVMNLGNLGIDIQETSSRDEYGYSVVGIGDANADGFNDVLFSALNADVNSIQEAGKVFVLFGGSNIPQVLVNTELGDDGLIINGIERRQELGRAIGALGDINQDGYSDFAIGSTKKKEAHLIFGGEDFPQNASIEDLDRIRIYGRYPENLDLGSGATKIGDINGDGIEDIALGDFGRSPKGQFSAGTVYILYGKPGLFQSLPQKSDLNDDGVVDNKDLFLFGSQWQTTEQ